MSFNTSLFSKVSSFEPKNGKGPGSTDRIFARVVDICLDSTHPDYVSQGKLQALNGIRYKVLSSSVEEETKGLPFAYNSQPDFKRVPLINEIVEIVSGIGDSLAESTYKSRKYYTFVQNLWNNTHHNASPDLILGRENIILGEGIDERVNIANLQPFSGDTYVQGRLGQSLRFTGYLHPKNPFSNETNNGDPLAILRVGQDPAADPMLPYVESINKDSSSIYLTSNHSIALIPSANRQTAFQKNDTPVSFGSYKGSQIIIDSGRIVLHSKSESILLNSKKAIGLSSASFNASTERYISFDSPEIYLGANSTEPVVLGNKNEDLLKTLFILLRNIAQGLNSIKDPASAVTILAGLGPIVEDQVKILESKLKSIKSNKVKVIG